MTRVECRHRGRRGLLVIARSLPAFLAACAFAGPTLAQSPTAGSLVPRSGFFGGLGGGYQSIKFGTQDVYAIGTSEVTQNGTVYATGVAAGPGTVSMPNESTFAPTVQGGYFQHFADSAWLWGAKLRYAYLDTTASAQNVVLPQFGSFTLVSTGATTPFVGNAVIRTYRTKVEHQIAFTPILGRSFDRSFVYVGAGPTWSRTQTNADGLVGFADIEGHHTDVSGAPQDFSASGWVGGVAGIVGATWFFDSSWFVDVSYDYARTKTQTLNYSGTFSNASNPFGTTTGTLVGSSSGRLTTQGVMLTINKVF